MSGIIPIAYLKIGITPSRAVFNGGTITGASISNISDFLNIAALSNTTTFGTLVYARSNCSGASSSTRGLTITGNTTPAFNQNIEYCTIASQGTSSVFGSITTSTLRDRIGAASNQTRAILSGGDLGGTPSTYTNAVSYVQIAVLSSVIAFGTLPATNCGSAGASSTTRAVFFGGGNSAYTTAIYYVTIGTLGNALSFGTVAGTARTAQAACSSNTIAITMGGYSGTTVLYTNMERVTIATTGNTTSFGTLDINRAAAGAASNKIRGVIAGGKTGALTNNPIASIRYFTIGTSGSTSAFGNLSQGRNLIAGFSDSHGGL